MPKPKGLTKRSTDAMGYVSDTEAEVLDVLWEAGRPMTPQQVAEEIAIRRRPAGRESMNFGTVSTILRRLRDLGMLELSRGEGQTPIYHALVTREELGARIMSHFSETILKTPLSSLLSSLAGTLTHNPNGSASGQKIDSLLSAIEKLDAQSE